MRYGWMGCRGVRLRLAENVRRREKGVHGFVLADGEVFLANSELIGNGIAIDGYDLWLQERSSGSVLGTELSGTGEGARVALTRSLTVD